MFISKNFRTEISELETKETECKNRLYRKINHFGKSVGVELEEDQIEELISIMTLNKILSDINRKKNIKVLKKGFTLKVRYLLYKGWIKNFITNTWRNINGLTRCI